MKLKNLLALLSVILLFSCNVDTELINFKITGTLKNLEGASVKLQQNREIVDSTIVKDGKFKLKGKLWNHQQCEILFQWKNPSYKGDRGIVGYMPFIETIAEEGDYEFYAESGKQIFDHTYILKTNAVAAQQFYDYDKERYRLNTEAKNRINELNRQRKLSLLSKNYQLFDELTDSIDLHEEQRKTIFRDVNLKYIKRNPNSYLTLYLLSKAPDISYNTDFYIGIEKKLTQPYRDHLYAKEFIKKLTKHRSDLPINIKIDAVNAAEQAFDLNKFKNNKFIVLDFWATWCEPCLKEMPVALEVEKVLNRKNISYAFISYDSRVKTWKSQSETLGLTHSYRLEKSAKSYLNQHLNMESIPRYVIINTKGDVLVKTAPSPSDPKFMAKIDELLAD